MLYATIMAGGAGTRFWPASRHAWPKQLLSLVGEASMLQATVARLKGVCADEQILILTNEKLVAATLSQLPTLPDHSVIGEPCKRDTAPCIALAAGLIALQDPEATMLVMPADHVIQQVDQFHAAIETANQLLERDPNRLITFGIQPSYPAQIFGYIERAEAIDNSGFQVKQFCEKPNAETAQRFIDSGDFYWNSGIFLWKCSTILRALRQLEPTMMQHIDTIVAASGSEKFNEVLQREFTKIKGTSIDYAVMEHYDNVCVVPAPFDWDDLGTWSAIQRLSGLDQHRNSISGKHLGLNTTDCIIYTDQKHLVVTLGLKDCLVVHTKDATLVADKTDEAAVKQAVAQLEELGWNEYL